jgi:hypothetical protein
MAAINAYTLWKFQTEKPSFFTGRQRFCWQRKNLTLAVNKLSIKRLHGHQQFSNRTLIEQILTDSGFDFSAFIRMNRPYPLN